MTRRLDLGALIAGASAIAVVGAVVAGLIVVGNPADERAERIDALRTTTIRQIAVAAQCAYTYTGEVPADIAAIETALSERRRAVGACDGVFLPADSTPIAYEAAPPEHVNLCAAFLRPSPPADAELEFVQPGSAFPELRTPRASPGQHCYRIRLVDQANAAQTE